MGKRNEGHRHKFLDGPLQAVMLRALFPQAAFMPTQQSIYATIQLHSRCLYSTTRALVDNGATDNFISPTLLQTSNIRVIQSCHLLATYHVTYFTTYLIRRTKRRPISEFCLDNDLC